MQITEGKYWADKPRWSPDGKTIYFISIRTGFLNVWAIRFDPVNGKPEGEPFQVTRFVDPSRMAPAGIFYSELSITDSRLVLPVPEAAGNIWVLENVDQ